MVWLKLTPDQTYPPDSFSDQRQLPLFAPSALKVASDVTPVFLKFSDQKRAAANKSKSSNIAIIYYINLFSNIIN